MGLVIRIRYSYDWEITYFVQELNREEAKQKAYKMFKETTSCWLPDTLEEAEKDDRFYLEIVAEVEQIIL